MIRTVLNNKLYSNVKNKLLRKLIKFTKGNLSVIDLIDSINKVFKDRKVKELSNRIDLLKQLLNHSDTLENIKNEITGVLSNLIRQIDEIKKN